MEFEDVGAYCHYDLCGQHTYLPFKCNGCQHQFCKLHINFESHQCANKSQYTIQSEIKIDPYDKSDRLTYNTCAYSKCDKQTPITILCKQCNQLFCVKHRYIDDHNCGKDLGDTYKFDPDGYENMDELKLDHLSDNDENFTYERQPSDDIHYQSITRMQNIKNASKSTDIEVIDTHKFDELRKFGYNDKQIYNAWYFLKLEKPNMTPENDTFINKMIDILSLQQMGYNQIHEDDNEFYNPKNESIYSEQKFNVQQICESLHDDITIFSMKNDKKHKVNAFINLICNTTNKQRQQIKSYYKQRYLGNLDHYINMNFKGSIFKRMLLYSMQNELEQNEYLLRISIKKTKDINCISQILCIMETEQINELISFHDKGMFRKSLKSQIIKMTVNDLKLRLFLLNIINGIREKSSANLDQNHSSQLAKDISFLEHILSKMNWSKLEEIRLINIFSSNSFEYLYLLCQTFKASTNMSLIDVYDNALGIDNGIGYAIHNILLYLMDINMYYINLLNKSMKYEGHKYIFFWRIIFDRIHIDLNKILKCLYESDVDRYNFKQFINNILHQQDNNAANLIKQLCKLN